MPIRVQSGDPAFDALPEAATQWLEAAAVTLALGEQTARGYRAGSGAPIVLREHAAALGAAVYLHADLTSALDIWLRAPLPDGSLFDSFAPLAPAAPLAPSAAPDAAPPSQPPAPSPQPPPLLFDDHIRNLTLRRDRLRADSESRAVQAAHRVWQATGDSVWLQAHLPVLQRALDHLWRHPHRWSGELDLPKRPFTLDAWPVEYEGMGRGALGTGDGAASSVPRTSRPAPQWCVHPGDAAQLYAACRALATMLEAAGGVSHAAGIASDAACWRERAEHIQARINSVGWNGRFYTHQLHVTPLRVRGVDESRQLAACNAAAMNAGLASREQCAAILKEYQRRRELQLETSFCEWWSVQPPFPEAAFGVAPGVGPNGGCWPSVGGELALAALSQGFETYGVETLRRYYELAVKPRRSFAWHHLDGTPGRGDDGLSAGGAGHDPEGASAMLRALIEGVCGVRDDGVLFNRIHLAPRWPATGQAAAEVEVSYAANPAYITYRWALDGGRMTLDWDCKARHVDLHILLPRGNTPERVALNGRTHAYSLVTIEKSRYVDISTERKRGTVAITLK